MIPSITDLRKTLNETIIGQTDLVKTVTACLYRHLLKAMAVADGAIAPSPNNLLVYGNTGTGKTFTIKQACTSLKIPFIEVNSKSISQEGWAGKSLLNHLSNEFRDIQHSNTRYYPVIFLDEFDKLCMPCGSSNDENVNIHIQSSILKYIEGFIVNINGIDYDTSDFCWIFSGAFSSALWNEDKKQSIGFNEDINNDTSIQVLTDKLIKYGMMPELAGRITRFCKTNDFTEEMYRDLLCNPHAIFNQWISLFREKGFKIKDAEYSYIISEAVKRKLGARGLIQLLEPYIDEILEDNLELIDLNHEWNYFIETLNSMTGISIPPGYIYRRED